MAGKFDFDNIGKRMPYTLPPETYEEMAANIFPILKKERKTLRKRRIIRWCSISGIAAAACVALLLMVKPAPVMQTDPLTQIDVAYSHLSDADQEYLLEIYNEDFFLNQE